jgi:hypothetical protein
MGPLGLIQRYLARTIWPIGTDEVPTGNASVASCKCKSEVVSTSFSASLNLTFCGTFERSSEIVICVCSAYLMSCLLDNLDADSLRL